MTAARVARSEEAFLLGYLPHQVRRHLASLDLLELRTGAEGELAARIDRQLTAIREHGPEIVSCVWHLECILFECLGVRPPAPPRDQAEGSSWLAAIAEAFAKEAPAAEHLRNAYALGRYAGEAEAAVATAARVWELAAVASDETRLEAGISRAREALRAVGPFRAGALACPTMQSEAEAIARALEAACAIAERHPNEGSARTLQEIGLLLRTSARSLEAALRGTPRASIEAWAERRMPGNALLRRIADHERWIVPSADGWTPRIFPFDKRVLLAFSDRQALADRPAFVEADADTWLTVPGRTLLSWLPDARVDLLVLDAGSDPTSPRTINYPAERHALLRRAAEEARIERAVVDWSDLDLDALRAHAYWVLVGGSALKGLVALDALGRSHVAVFTSEAALDAYLAAASPEHVGTAAATDRRLLPGHTLFEVLRTSQMPVLVNPNGPGGRRALNKHTVAALATAPAARTGSATTAMPDAPSEVPFSLEALRTILGLPRMAVDACPTCSVLPAQASLFEKAGNVKGSIPDGFRKLDLLLECGANRINRVFRCSACRCAYLHEKSYEYLVNGSEDLESFERMTPEALYTWLSEEVRPASFIRGAKTWDLRP